MNAFLLKRYFVWRSWNTSLLIALVCGVLSAHAVPVVLPVELSTWDVQPVEKTVSVNVPPAVTADKLYLQIHNIRFGGQVSVRVNAGDWKNLFNHNVELVDMEDRHDGIGGINATIRMYISLEPGEIVAGQANTVTFRLNGTDGISTAIRVLKFNFVDASYTALIPGSEFADDNPALWTPPSYAPSDISAGETLWNSAALINDSISRKPINASCASCHFDDGSDLKYFNYSNQTIIDRSRFHGLSYDEGAQIASYIRSLTGPSPGRPWNPPFQPGPGLDPQDSDSNAVKKQKAESWMAGAGIDAVAENDADIFPHLFPMGATRSEVAKRIDYNKTLSVREIPVPVQMPDWNMWLPDVAPEDCWSDVFYYDQAWAIYENFRTAFPDDSLSEAQIEAGLDLLRSTGQLNEIFQDFTRDLENFHGDVRGGNGTANETAVALARNDFLTRETLLQTLMRWKAVKMMYIVRDYALEDKPDSQDYMRNNTQHVNWTNEKLSVPGKTNRSNVWPMAPHIIGNNINYFEGQLDRTGRLESNQWYILQLLINSGNRVQAANNVPLDWDYIFLHYRYGAERTGNTYAMTILMTMMKMIQLRETGLGVQRYGVNPRFSHPWFFYTDSYLNPSQFRGGLEESFPGLWRTVYEEYLHEWLDVAQQIDVNTIPRGTDFWTLDATNTVPQNWTSGAYFVTHPPVHVNSFYRLFPLLLEEDIDELLLADFAAWCNHAWPYNAATWGATTAWSNLLSLKNIYSENFEDNASDFAAISVVEIRDANYENLDAIGPKNGGGRYVGSYSLAQNASAPFSVSGLSAALSGAAEVKLRARIAYSPSNPEAPGEIQFKMRLIFDSGTMLFDGETVTIDPELFDAKFLSYESTITVPAGATAVNTVQVEWAHSGGLDGGTVYLENVHLVPVSPPSSDITAPGAPSISYSTPNDKDGIDKAIKISIVPPAAPDLAGYHVYRWENGAPENTKIKLNRGLVNTVFNYYEDYTPRHGVTYNYQATAVDDAGNESNPSATLTAGMAEGYGPNSIGLNWMRLGLNSLQLGWYAVPDIDLKGYRIYRRAEGEAAFSLLADEFNQNGPLFYEDTDVVEDMRYEYYVDAVDENGWINRSATIVIGTDSFVAPDILPAQHLDASDPSNVIESGGTVSQWTDISGNGNHGTAGGGTAPSYPGSSLFGSGDSGIDLGSSRKYVELFTSAEQDALMDFSGVASNQSGFAVLVAFKVDAVLSGSRNPILVNHGNQVEPKAFGLRYEDSGSPLGVMEVFGGGTTFQKTGEAPVEDGDTIIYAFNYEASTGEFEFWDSKNGTSLIDNMGVQTDFSSTQSLKVGGSNNGGQQVDAHVGEVLIFNEKLSRDQFRRARESLTLKWLAPQPLQHLDAADVANVNTSGGVVTQWDDISGNSLHAVPAFGGKPTYPGTSLADSGLAGLDMRTNRNGLTAFTSAGQDAWLDFSGAASNQSGFTVFTAFKADSILNTVGSSIPRNTLFVNHGNAATSESFGLRYNGSGSMEFFAGGSTYSKPGAVVAAGDTVVYGFKYISATGGYTFWDSKNGTATTGTLTANANFSSVQNLYLGTSQNNGQWMDGMLGEVLVFDEALNDDQFMAVNGVLSNKWVVPGEATEIITVPWAPEETYAAWADSWAYTIGPETNDFDMDGVNNLFEYASGGDPTDPADRGSLPLVEKSGDYMLYRFRQRKGDSGLNYSVFSSTNLVEGIWGPEPFGPTDTDSVNFQFQDVEMLFPEIDPALFIQLEVERP